MFLIRKPHDFKSISTCIRLYSLARKSHYEVLNLRRNCSDKDIKEAFIQMSKEYHPDKNKDVKAQEKFVRIVEAYNILGKPGSRAQYDSTVEIPTSSGTPSYVYRTHVPHNLRKNPNYSYYYQSESNANSTKEKARSNNYYGFSGIKKLPNYYIICLCFGAAFFGVMIQLVVIRNMYVIQRTKAHERSMLLAEELNRVRAAAKENGKEVYFSGFESIFEDDSNKLQTRLLLDKIVTAANPTVTTASLGQALASENKDGSETLLSELGISEVADEWYDASSQDDMKVNLYDVIRKIMSYIC